MTYMIEFDPYDYMIKASAQGRLGLIELTEFIDEIISLAKREHCFYILTSLDQAQIDITLLEFYFIPFAISDSLKVHNLKNYTLNRAIIGSNQQKILQYYDTVARNRGHSTRLFYDTEVAKEWLRICQRHHLVEKDRIG